MTAIREYSISTRLTLINIVVSISALALAFAAVFIYDWYSFRASIVRQLSIEAQIIGSHSITGLIYEEPGPAQNAIATLEQFPNISRVVIAQPNGAIFASYVRNKTRPVEIPQIEPGEIEESLVTDSHVGVARRINDKDNEEVGIIYVESDLAEFQERQWRYAQIMGVVVLIALLAALAISYLTRRAISQPIAQLASVARTVTREKNYSVRAVPTGYGGEPAILTESFNEMLGQIQERDTALQQARDELERRVEQRTEQLAAANKELEAFSYSVSHDLRAPLRHIDGFSSILVEQFGPQMDPTARRYLDYVREGAQNMGRLVDDLLSMARISRQEMVLTPTDLNVLVKTSIDGQDIADRNIEWKIEDLPTVECDPGLIQIVFTNLISNAVKYSRQRDPAIIEVGQMLQNDVPVFFVRDNGAGFEQQYAHKLFGVFQRLHRADEFEGTGVGLATVQRIINRHGGRIWATGEVGKGATFFFTLG